MLSKPFTNLNKFKNGLCSAIIRFYCSLCCNKRERMARDDLYDHYMLQLDIENMVRRSLSLSDFFRCYLTDDQKVMLAHQRNKFPGGNSESEQSNDDNGESTISAIDSQILAKHMTNFKPSSTFEKRLLLGVLYRGGIPPNQARKVVKPDNIIEDELSLAAPIINGKNSNSIEMTALVRGMESNLKAGQNGSSSPEPKPIAAASIKDDRKARAERRKRSITKSKTIRNNPRIN